MSISWNDRRGVRVDQDFHYYGTYYAARTAGLEATVAARIARASNFIDFMHEGDYGGRWDLVSPDGEELGQVDHPRYTFQAGTLSTGVAPEDGLWCSYHFAPGNYDHIDAPSTIDVHGSAVAGRLPAFELRDVRSEMGSHAAPLLNRPQSAVSRALIADTHRCARNTERVEEILNRAVAGPWLLEHHRDDVIDRFRQLLIGARAHVIADTWAHQDWSGINHEINTYFDVSNSWGRQAIEYQDIGDEWHSIVLSVFNHANLQAVPNATSYLGHGWMGHFPDYSFVRYRYKPRWRPSDAAPLVRDNPDQYRHAFLEMCSLFARCGGLDFDPTQYEVELAAAARAIDAPCVIASKDVCPRAASSQAWLAEFADVSGSPATADLIDAEAEPDPAARLDGLIDQSSFPISLTPWGSFTVDALSDLYLFQVAADYHFHFMKRWLSTHRLREFTGSWSQHLGPLDASIESIALDQAL